jgi:predicted ATPase
MTDSELTTGFIPSLYKPASLLPIARHRESLLYLIETYPTTIVVGQTGSGKTTQIPQFLEQAGWCADGKIVGITQVSYKMQARDSVWTANGSVAASSGRDDGCYKSGRGDGL